MGEFTMSEEKNRLKSFHEYPLPSESPEAHDVGASLLRYPSAVKLAKAGFYRFSGCRGDEVKCYRCGVKCSGWEGRSPLSVHRILSPRCPHMLMTSPNTSVYDGGSGNDVPISTLDVYICHQESVNNRQNSSGDGSMYFERLRLLTFPSPTNQQAKEFAGQGFVFLREGRGRCVFCKLDLLLQSENPTRKHKQQSPNCPLVRKLDVGNIPQALEEAVRREREQSCCEDEEPRHGDTPTIQHPQYRDVQVRQNSFGTWPVALIPTPSSLALAGFYYTGFGDKVRCYFCGITLLNWRVNAEPWSQHARQAPSCKFVELEMGIRYLAVANQYQVLTDIEPFRNLYVDAAYWRLPFQIKGPPNQVQYTGNLVIVAPILLANAFIIEFITFSVLSVFGKANNIVDDQGAEDGNAAAANVNDNANGLMEPATNFSQCIVCHIEEAIYGHLCEECCSERFLRQSLKLE